MSIITITLTENFLMSPKEDARVAKLKRMFKQSSITSTPLPLAFNKGGPATQDELLEVNLGWHDPVTHQNSVHARWRPASHNGVKKLFINLLLIKQSPNRLVDACLLQNPLETVEIVARPTSEARTSIDGSEMEKTYVVGKFGPRIFPNHI